MGWDAHGKIKGEAWKFRNYTGLTLIPHVNKQVGQEIHMKVGFEFVQLQKTEKEKRKKEKEIAVENCAMH